MRTTCVIPAIWTLIEARPDGFVRHHHADAGLTLEILPPGWLDDPAYEREAIVGASPVDQVRIGQRRRDRTGDGWPLELIEVAVIDGAELVEARLVALVEFLQRRGAVRVRARPPGGISEHDPIIGAIVRSARPDWRGAEPVALSELWS